MPEVREPAPDAAGDGFDVARRLLATVAVLAVVGTVLGLLLVQRLGTTYRDGLEVTQEGADVASLGTTTAAELATDVAGLADAASASLEQARSLVEQASTAAADVGDAMGTNIADGVEGTGNIANGMAGFIEAIERLIPGDSKSLAEDLRALSDGLAPVPDQLRSLGDQLIATSADLTDATASLDDIAVQLATLAASIDEAQATLARVEVLADDLAVRAGHALDRSGRDLWLLRLLVVVLGLGVAGACLAAHRALGALQHRVPGAGGGTRTHTPRGTGT